jgi:MarR family transcriptional regulator, organic hydroperoxide resistance regulator
MESSVDAPPGAAREAWGLFWRIFMEDKRRRWTILSEMADALHCDNSNVTGIVDRLEAAGLAERRPSERDRRVKAVVLTEKGEWTRIEIERRAGQPPPQLAKLSEEDAATLRDILARALED